MENCYAGRILHINLTTGEIDKRDLNEKLIRQYLGGTGIAARLYYDAISEGQIPDPLAPENPSVIMTGPLTGARLDGAARWTVMSRSPMTGFLGIANCGGYFGSRLKMAGYDGIVVTGAAPSPTYISINNDQIELRDASWLWGQDVYQTTDALMNLNNRKRGGRGDVLAIGPAGERMVRFASLIHRKVHSVGRTGMGAVWGSKNLKAIHVNGSNRYRYADRSKFRELASAYREKIKDSIVIQAMSEFSTVSYMGAGIMLGDVPIKNWSTDDWDQIDRLSTAAIADKLYVGKLSCHRCTIDCRRESEVKTGKYKSERGPGPDYETVVSFGSLLLNSNLEVINKANEMCNRFGMDTISCGSTIAFAIECFENGLLKLEDTNGLGLTWGDGDAILELIDMIGNQQGLGSMLSEGSASAADTIGGNSSDYLTTIKGLEAPMHDPRSYHGLGLSYAVSPLGASHTIDLQFILASGSMILPEFGDVLADYQEQSSEGKYQMVIISQDYGSFFAGCAGFCVLGASDMNASEAIDLVNAATGLDLSLKDVMEIGQRTWYLTRSLSNLFGADASHDRLPKRIRTALQTGPTAGSTPDMERMLKEFYAARDLDSNGIPSRQMLVKLGLDDIAARLHY